MKNLLLPVFLLALAGCSETYSGGSPVANIAPSAPVLSSFTSGLRSGDFAIAEDSIDAILNNPVKESYPKAKDNPFKSSKNSPLSTFSIDVDTASYSNFRRFVTQKQTPEEGAIRTEEMVNYFDYDYAPPTGEHPFSVATEIASCPWNEDNRLALVALRAKDIAPAKRPRANLVFLLDVSGSMADENKLPLVKKSFLKLLDELNGDDRVAIVTYAGNDRVALPPTLCSDRNSIKDALKNLESGGSTNGQGGLEKAYQLARENFQADGINRVILATDGDFNIGKSKPEALKKLIQKEARSGVALTALGFGMYNLRDDTLQALAQNGNGHHAYIDTLAEAEKVLVTELPATLQTVAKDVKIQVAFNPDTVESYRLIGYETRHLENRDFANDSKDAGDMGSGHKVTALYEIVPKSTQPTPSQLFTLRLRHKAPSSNQSKLQTVEVSDTGKSFKKSSREFHFASSVAAFSQWMNHNPELDGTSRKKILSWAKTGSRRDPHGYRKEFLKLAAKAKRPHLIAAE